MSDNLLFRTNTDHIAFTGPKTVIKVFKNRIEFYGCLFEGKFFERNEYITLFYKNIKSIRYIEPKRPLIEILLPFLKSKPVSWLAISTYDNKDYYTVHHTEQAEIKNAYDILMELL